MTRDRATDMQVETYWLNIDKLAEMKCIHHVAEDNEPREFKGVKVVVATAITEAAPELLNALQLVAAALDTYEAPPELVATIVAALNKAQGTP